MADEVGEFGGLVMVDGRGWTDDLPPESAIDRFNRMAMDNPIYGHNDVLDRMSRFDTSKYYAPPPVEDDPELDQYVQTLFLDGLGENGYDIDGDPYGEFKKEYSGPAPEANESMYPELDAANAADFISQFGKIFKGN